MPRPDRRALVKNRKSCAKLMSIPSPGSRSQSGIARSVSRVAGREPNARCPDHAASRPGWCSATGSARAPYPLSPLQTRLCAARGALFQQCPLPFVADQRHCDLTRHALLRAGPACTAGRHANMGAGGSPLAVVRPATRRRSPDLRRYRPPSPPTPPHDRARPPGPGSSAVPTSRSSHVRLPTMRADFIRHIASPVHAEAIAHHPEQVPSFAFRLVVAPLLRPADAIPRLHLRAGARERGRAPSVHAGADDNGFAASVFSSRIGSCGTGPGFHALRMPVRKHPGCIGRQRAHLPAQSARGDGKAPAAPQRRKARAADHGETVVTTVAPLLAMSGSLRGLDAANAAPTCPACAAPARTATLALSPVPSNSHAYTGPRVRRAAEGRIGA